MQNVSTLADAGTLDRHETPVPTVTEPASPNPSPLNPQTAANAKEYNRIKIWIGLAETALLLAFTLVVLVGGFSIAVEKLVSGFSGNAYIALLLFAACFGLAESVISFPLSYYSGYHLEHTYQLSNQSFLRWVWEGLKGMLVGIPIATPILLAVYYCLRNFQELWWLPVGGVIFFFSVVMARLGPTLIFPLFYKFKPIGDGTLKTKVMDLCSRVGMNIEGVYLFDMSKNTKKANAAFAGIGKSKRIILGDTLVANFTDEEIEAVVAHELGHYKLKHIRTMILVGTATIFLGLFIAANLYQQSLPWFGFTRIDQIAALPLLTLWLGLYSFVTTPISNAISREHERQADRFSVTLLSRADTLKHALVKLATTNLADTHPPAIIEFMFHSHPSIDKRIRLIDAIPLTGANEP